MKIKRILLSVITIIFTISAMTIVTVCVDLSRKMTVNGATATGTLTYYDSVSGAYAHATTSINRAQLCSVSVSVEGTYYISNSESSISLYATGTIGNGYGGQNGCETSITAPQPMWIRVTSSHRATYNGETKIFVLPS